MVDIVHEAQQLVAKVQSSFAEKFVADEALLIQNYTTIILKNAAPEDLIERDSIDFYGALVSHWQFISRRQPDEAKVRVYNPQFEQHGWQSTHTVIDIVAEDMPFIVDSVRMELNRRGFNTHLLLHSGCISFERDASGKSQSVSANSKQEGRCEEATMLIEIDKQSDPVILESIKKSIESVLNDVSLCVNDWQAMREKINETLQDFERSCAKSQSDDMQECLAFLNWVKENHFTFLGVCERKLIQTDKGPEWEIDETSLLGLMRKKSHRRFHSLIEMPLEAQKLITGPQPLILGKTSHKATVHRPVNTDFISVKYFDDKGEVTKEVRFIGLYTSAAYHRSVQSIPLLRHKARGILARGGFDYDSHDGKIMLNIIETLPRDDLIQASIEELHQLCIGIMYIRERQRIRLFMRKDIYGRYFSCLVYVPRERFNSQLRREFQSLLTQALGGIESSFTTQFSDSVLARLHFIIRIPMGYEVQYDIDKLEQMLIEAARTWRDLFKQAIMEHAGEEKGNFWLYQYADAFPPGYQAEFAARTAVYDIEHIETLSEDKALALSFYRSLEEPEDILRLKIFKENSAAPLSDVIPMLECMGLKVLGQRPHRIQASSGQITWINDFTMTHQRADGFNADEVKNIFQDAFYNIWKGNCESDGFNQLVLRAGLNWRQITMLRAYAKYMWQCGFTFSQQYIEEALAEHSHITRNLVKLFEVRFQPNHESKDRTKDAQALLDTILSQLDEVSNLDEDRIIRRYTQKIMGTLRTNFYQTDAQGCPKPYVSFKINPKAIQDMPRPRPMFEIFVYSPWMEGVHLRGAKVARGGLRWSDRREDFRTEVLGLMKAQQVKNSVIVPLGAKGGFVVKQMPQDGNRDAIQKAGIHSYQTFIRALLDVTDNIIDNQVVPAPNVVRYDEDDTYLVVAADKGTATFSDIANEISNEYQFWLGDAFASGGSAGYDHKKMGITARGAWESVKRHFREMGHDTQTQPFTVVGVGDMGGDVFGNGMLLSKQIKLVAAFNHMHIFIDPDPNPEESFEERQRMFDLPRSTWMDYNPKMLSKGGAVYARSSKFIELSPEAKALFDVKSDRIEPNELIKKLLKAEVDLLWNGGIGTYVKATSELHSEVGDRANDAVRINGQDLRAKVVGEGGNLGLTQLGRVEFALNGGCINTDAIDNSGGVDCSDHEVNIKILLNSVVLGGDMTIKQRNHLLEDMTDEVAELVLENNRAQGGAISLALMAAEKNTQMHIRLIEYLEKHANLDRELEFIPSNEVLMTRKQEGLGLTRPELSVLLAYSKTLLKERVLNSDCPEDPFISQYIKQAFPEVLEAQYRSAMDDHRLRREITAMIICNMVIDEMGPHFIHRLEDETGAESADIVRAFVVARHIFRADYFREAVKALDFIVDASVQLDICQELNRLVRRGTRWFLRQYRKGLDIQETIDYFYADVLKVSEQVREVVRGAQEDYIAEYSQQLIDSKVPEELAFRAASMNAMFSALDIVESSKLHNLPVESVIQTYYTLGAELEIGWVRQAIKMHPVTSHWDALARAAFRDDLDRQQRMLTIGALYTQAGNDGVEATIDNWLDNNSVLVGRWKSMIAELRAHANRDFIMYSVALRELLDLSQASMDRISVAQSNNEVGAA